jgi:hypothetical protein
MIRQRNLVNVQAPWRMTFRVLVLVGAAWVVALGMALGPVGSSAGQAAIAETRGAPGPAVGSTLVQERSDPWFSVKTLDPPYPSPFYPQVKDGYKDYQELYWYSDEYVDDENAPYGADYTVTNSDDVVVFTGHVGTDKTYLRWRGVDDSGELVPVGVYKLNLTAYDAEGDGHELIRQATVATGETTRSETLTADAATKPRIYRTVTRGNHCDVRRATDRGTLVLSCSGGRGFAKAVFTLDVPATDAPYAEITMHRMSRDLQGLCWGDRGSFTQKVWQVDSDTVQYNMKVAGVCTASVYSVFLRYTYDGPA